MLKFLTNLFKRKKKYSYYLNNHPFSGLRMKDMEFLPAKDYSHHMVIRCEILNVSMQKAKRGYLIQDLKLPCELLGEASTPPGPISKNADFLRVGKTNTLSSISSAYLSTTFFGRLIVDENNNPVATIYEVYNVVSITE